MYIHFIMQVKSYSRVCQWTSVLVVKWKMMDRLALEKLPLQQAVDQKEQVHAKPFFNLQETRRKFAPCPCGDLCISMSNTTASTTCRCGIPPQSRNHGPQIKVASVTTERFNITP